LIVRAMSAMVENRPPTLDSLTAAGAGDLKEGSDGAAADKLSGLVDQLDNCDLNENTTEEETAVDLLGAPAKVVKHPLQNAWTLWFFKNEKGRSWDQNQRQIITVSTVEDFWSLYNHIELASKIPTGCDYSLFKEGIFPDWEDVRNKPGGRWIINLHKNNRAQFLDTYWLEILFFLIGEHADQYAFQVNGAAVNVRLKGDKLAIWLADSTQPDSILRIGKMLKERLGIDPGEKIGFTIHDDERTKAASSIKRQKYYV
jgi:translation initiation factor 4E